MGYLSSCNADSSIFTSDSHTPFHHQNPRIQEFNYKDLELATNNFSDTKLLGRGSHGLVYKGVLRNGRRVAIKRPAQKTHENPNEVENEIDILSNLHYPGLVNIVGFTKNDSHDRLLVVEFMSNGTLYDILHSNSQPPNWGRRIKLALQIAKAIDSLHSLTPPVIHRDVKSANVLIDRNFDAKLGDFGLALRVDDYKLQSTPPAGTMGYLDPCYVTPDNLSTKNDVFSFGILLLEIMSGRKAIDVGYSPPSIVDWALPLIRKGKLSSIFDPRIKSPKDGYVRKILALVAAKCVRNCRERRPVMKDVVRCLDGLSKIVPDHSWNGFGNPCLAVDAVGGPVGLSKLVKDRPWNGLGNPCLVVDAVGKLPVQSRKVCVDPKGKNDRVKLRDLRVRTNLMELMARPDGELRFRGKVEGLEVKIESSKRGLSLGLKNG